MKIWDINFSELLQRIDLKQFRMFKEGLIDCGNYARKERGRYHYSVITYYKQIIGFISWFKQSKDTCHVDMIEIIPEYRGLGLGKQLLLYIEKQAKDKGFSKIKITARRDYLVRYYKKLGYKRVFYGTTRMYKVL